VLREEAIEAATRWLRSCGHSFGALRFACYQWDYRSGYELWGRHYTRGLITVPTLGFLRGDPNRPLVTFQRYRLVHGWAVVFDPLDRVPEGPEDCFVVWVSELGSSLRSRQPRSLEFEFTLPLTGGLWPKELQDAEH
jgi:hypothetical protein